MLRGDLVLKRKSGEKHISGLKPSSSKLGKLAALNGLSPREWTLLSRNVWNDVSSPRSKRHLEHGAVFPQKLAERLVTMY